MKISLALLFLLNALPTYAYFHYPEDRNYTATDRGYTQYGAPSLHRTGKYALTFDDGPHPVYTAKILDTLKANNVKATFFIITTNVNEKTFPLIKRMLDEGHIVASHGRNHDNSNNITKAVWKSRVKQSFIELAAPIDFSSLTKIKMKVWSPAAGITVKMKLENLATSSINIERDAVTTVANGWEELTYDFSGIVNSNNYQRLVVFFDFGNAGTGATYYFDDIKLSN